MKLRIHNWRDILVCSAGITLLSVLVPVVTLAAVLWAVPFQYSWPILVSAAVIPLLIAFPISIFALNLVRQINVVTERLDVLVRVDPLTGLFNRNHFMRVVDGQRRLGGCLVLADADRFKAINDTHGHDAGDKALVHLSRHLLTVFGPYGTVGRIGGEEFGIYLPKLAQPQLRLLFAAVSNALRTDPLFYDSTEITLSLSMGGVPDRKGMSFAELSKKADLCLYAAKAGGRNCCFVMNEVDEPVLLVA